MDSSRSPGERISYREVFARLENLPPLSRSLERLLGLLRNDRASANDLEEVLRHDEVISVKVLQIANSAYYGVHGKVATLQRAILTMGFHEVISVCLCRLLTDQLDPLGRPAGASRAALWKESYVAAGMARELARGRSGLDMEEAYTLGLLHDLGLLVMCMRFNEEYRDIMKVSRERKIPYRQAELERGPLHTQIGKWIALRWGLPESYAQVMAYHHEPMDSPTCRAQVKLVFLAGILARCHENPSLLNDGKQAEFCRDLAISEDEWQVFIERTAAAREEANRFWRLLG